MDIDKSVREIEDAFRKVDCPRVFAEFEKLIVRREDDTPMFVPCLPVVGKNYKEAGILVLATAQNWEDGRTSKCESYRQWPNERLEEVDDYRAVKIQPWQDGVLPALVAMYLSAQGAAPATGLESIASQCAVSNFFKFSLRQRGDKSRDMNPSGLGKETLANYVTLTFEQFVGRELEVLKPRVVISFARPLYKLVLLRSWRPELSVVGINDPAWMKRGMRKTTWPPSSSAPDFLEGYLEQLASPYCNSKKDAAMRYLLHYLEEWRGGSRAPSA